MQIHLQVIFTIGCNLMRMYEYLNKISSSSLFTSCRKYKRPRLIQILVYNTEYTPTTICISGFFLKATLWPDFTELLFPFFWFKQMVIFTSEFWMLLVPKKTISKLSGNTVRSTHKSSESFIRYFTFHWKLN